jgi:flagellar basal body-associated protein FliL
MHDLALILQLVPGPEMIHRILLTIIPILICVYLFAIAIVMVPCWLILKKAGFTPWLALLCVIPSLGTLVLLYVLAFGDWKVIPAPQAYWPPQSPTVPPQQPPPFA